MPSVPNNLSLDTISNGAQILSQPLRDNYTDIQVEFNKAVAVLDGGTSGQVLTNQGGGSADWATPASPGTIPAGAVTAYGGAAAPAGWLLCDGTAVARGTYGDLFTAIGTAYGAGDGTTTFNLPDLRGRVPVGKGTHVDVDALGDSDGMGTVANRRPKHRHTPHSHSANAFTTSAEVGFMGGGTTAHSTPSVNTADGGSGNANDSLDAPAYLVLNYIIKT